MASHMCCVVPPYLLDALCECSDPELREMAASTLAFGQTIQDERHEFSQGGFTDTATDHHDDDTPGPAQGIVPDYLLESIGGSGEDPELQKADRAAADAEGLSEAGMVASQSGFFREVYDMEHSAADTQLPGKPRRAEGDGPHSDPAVNEVYDNALKVLLFYQKYFNLTSVDNNNMKIVSSVHYGSRVTNAWWHHNQMKYGDGIPGKLGHYTNALDVIGHEITHGVTQFHSQIKYNGESGALNEHISDVFGIMVKQIADNTTADKADWLLGETCFMPDIKGVGLRNMLHPGTAWTRAKVTVMEGDDVQPDHYSKIAGILKNDPDGVKRDHGGVHYFSGIPNRAFALSATRFGGFSYEKAGKIWWTAVTAKEGSNPPTYRIPSTCTFAQFADVTVEVAKELFPNSGADQVVRTAWNDVGVQVKAH
ncbi:metalloprotease [Apodospora peruviana]|uniref:Metalloprotease n=1 Tax=Apodospora peruviana TaxID=516989 RepID=A0AAE0IP51_9PEZI|nr:metalloprotease [Apodospora peruviana]